MYKSILASLAVLFFQGVSFAETVTCNAFIMKATTQMHDEQKSIYVEKIELKRKPNELFWTATMTYQNMKLVASAYKDDRHDIYELRYVVDDLKSKKREITDQLFLLGVKPSKQNAWEDPNETHSYELIRTSLHREGMIGFYTDSAFAKLSPFGLDFRTFTDPVWIMDTVKMALKEGVLTEGEVIGAGFMENCFAK